MPETAFEHVTPGVLTARGGIHDPRPKQFQTITSCFGVLQTARKRRHGRSLVKKSLENNTGKAPSREGARRDDRDGARDGVKGGARGDTGDAANANGTTYGKCLIQRPIWCLVLRQNDDGNDARMANKRLREIAPGTVRETLPDCAKDSARNSLRNSARMALQTAHESARMTLR